MTITWEIDDGSICEQREYTTEIDDDELAECWNDEQREKVICECVQEDFEQKITWEEVSRS